MRAKITKKMCMVLNQELRKRQKANIYSSIFNFDYDDTLSIDMYNMFCGDSLEHVNDYDYSTGKFKVIRVIYNDTCYSYDAFITTNDLYKAAKKSNCNYEDFISEIFNTYEI